MKFLKKALSILGILLVVILLAAIILIKVLKEVLSLNMMESLAFLV